MYSKQTKIKALVLLSFITLLTLLIDPALAFDKKADSCDSCELTAQAAYEAGLLEAEEEYWTAVGKCYNLSNTSKCSKCLLEAEDELEDAKLECEEMLECLREICSWLDDGGPYDPKIVPGKFVDPTQVGSSVDPNPYWPLVTGNTWVYENKEDNEVITVIVTDETKEIMGVTCVVVKDVAEEDGVVIEETDDWYAQDVDGNVWYFGELSKEFEDGELVSLEGSWKGGVDGAKPGILIHADAALEIGNTHYQEFYFREAEDMAQVVCVDEESITVPYKDTTTFDDGILKTMEFTPIEPDVLENKYYAPGIGLILEVDLETEARVELVDCDIQ